MARNLKKLAKRMNDSAFLKNKPISYGVNKHKGKDRIFKFGKGKGKFPTILKIL